MLISIPKYRQTTILIFYVQFSVSIEIIALNYSVDQVNYSNKLIADIENANNVVQLEVEGKGIE